MDVESQLRLDRLDAIGVADTGQLSPRDGAGDRVAGDHSREQEADGDRNPGGEQVNAQSAKRVRASLARDSREAVNGDGGVWAQPQLSRSRSRTGKTTFGSLLTPLIIE